MGRWASLFVAAAVLGPIAALAVVGAVVWRRTSPLRSGRASPTPEAHDLPAAATTSRATLIPSAGGLAIVVVAAALAFDASGSGRSPPAGAIVLALAGGAIWWAGFATRVTALRAGPGGLTITWHSRRPLSMAWEACSELRSPRWPLGGWTVRGSRDGRVIARLLMPSDILGNEAILVAVVARAQLSFDGRSWRRS
jgi:hypothetical protein